MTIAKILIVDDHPENLLTLEQLLEPLDVLPIRALSGEEALTRTLDHDFALILLDVNMPGMSGYEVAELLRSNSRTRQIPIIFVTAALKEMSHIFKGYDSGGVDYLFKPLEPAILTGKVEIFLNLYRQKRALEKKTTELDNRLLELEQLKQQLEKSNEKLRLLSSLDGLTGLLNRRRFDEILAEEWQRSQRSQRPLALLIIDIDHFKGYNDSYGHLQGDQVLRKVANTLAATTQRLVDKVARYGGEEFVAILPDTDLDGAMQVAERMRQNISTLDIAHSASPVAKYLTVSIGAASTRPEANCSQISLIEGADSTLYEAKNGGRNRCVGKLLTTES